MLELWALARSPAASTPDTPEAATVLAGFDGWRGELYRLAVRPRHRRRGIGSGLVEEAERRLAEAGARRISVIAGADDGPALGQWRATGYETARTTRFVKNL